MGRSKAVRAAGRLLACLVLAAFCRPVVGGSAGQQQPTVTVDLKAAPTPVSTLLHGIFFEEIGHAGEGGLYSELVQDRSFDALALATGFHASKRPRLDIDMTRLAAARHQAAAAEREAGAAAEGCVRRGQRRKRAPSCSAPNDVDIAWQPLPGTAAALTRERPINPRNRIALEMTGAGAGPAGVVNLGFWGVPVQAGSRYAVSLYLRTPDGASPQRAAVALLPGGSPAAAQPLASASFGGLTPQWQRFAAELVAGATDANGSLAVLFDGPGRLVVDQVSLMPAAAVEEGQRRGLLNPWPFRDDLLGTLRRLRPRFLRFPGGCYVEGDWLRGAFRWKEALGLWEERPGHHNSMWGYWSTDGLGLFEYLLLAEELGAQPVWVVNNGVAHNDQVAPRDIWPWVQEAMDGIEFITGPASSTWGAVRAAMGRPHPWTLDFLAIGNEGCGLPWDTPNPNFRPFYWQNYLAFYGALKASHPHLRLIANCQLGGLGPTEIWEYHVYTNPEDMFGRRRAFQGSDPSSGGHIFASEYAVTDGGGHGNLVGAVAEAGFMLGLEKSSGGSGAVLAAAYAPLLVNANAPPWPTNLIVFDNRRAFGIPSYHVQLLLSQHLGTALLPTDAQGAGEVLEASATCQDEECREVSLKLVNFGPAPLPLCVSFKGLPPRGLSSTARLLALTSAHPEDENSFAQPLKVSPRASAVSIPTNASLQLPLPAWSLSILTLSTVPPAAEQERPASRPPHAHAPASPAPA